MVPSTPVSVQAGWPADGNPTTGTALAAPPGYLRPTPLRAIPPLMARAPMPALPPLPPAPPSGDGDSPPRHESGPVDEDLEVELDPSPSPLHDPTFIPVGSLRPRPSAQSAVPPDSDSPSDDRSPRGPARSRRAPLPPTEILRLALPKRACSGCPARLPSAYSVPGNTALDGPGPHACTSAPTTGPALGRR